MRAAFHGKKGTTWQRRCPARGFTLLEICIVLVILGVLMGVIAPGMQSALNEQSVRSDACKLSLLVKTAMLRSNEEHKAYVLNLSEKNWSLAPFEAGKDDTAAVPEDSWQLSNQLLLPDPKSEGNWQPILSAQWVFRPGQLCPATAVCFTRGQSRLELTFNALTGNAEDEGSIFQ
jgi:prepilin-type N-terminal cleavage/methylation domain-containing protein